MVMASAFRMHDSLPLSAPSKRLWFGRQIEGKLPIFLTVAYFHVQLAVGLFSKQREQ
jgi:hypothetical protein